MKAIFEKIHFLIFKEDELFSFKIKDLNEANILFNNYIIVNPTKKYSSKKLF